MNTGDASTNVLPSVARDHLALALDVDDDVAAIRLVRQLKAYFGVAKVGLELFLAAGPDICAQLMDEGLDVFLDLKLHDIPTTVGKAARVAGAYGVKYLTMHAHGGPTMLRAGVEGFLDGARNAGWPPPVPLAVTVLTSDDDAPPHIVGKRVAAAVEGGCKGVVCAAADVRVVKLLTPAARLVTVVPGIRPEASPTHDQARAATPTQALGNGADLLVIGRAVTHAPDREAVAAAIAAEVATVLAS
jgi:orotidine-5'-phosphate decarboxylase